MDSRRIHTICIDILLQVLLDKQFPARYIILLINTYVAQSIRVKWSSHVLVGFGGINSLGHEGVLAHSLFTVYLDELISEIKTCTAGCWIGNLYYGNLLFADDIVLLSPNMTALQGW